MMGSVRNSTGKALQSRGFGHSANPKNLLRLFLPRKLFFFSEVIFKDPPKLCFKTSTKITSRGYFHFLRFFFCLPRLFLKNSLKRFLGNRGQSAHAESTQGVFP